MSTRLPEDHSRTKRFRNIPESRGFPRIVPIGKIKDQSSSKIMPVSQGSPRIFQESRGFPKIIIHEPKGSSGIFTEPRVSQKVSKILKDHSRTKKFFEFHSKFTELPRILSEP
jgi:hypothetical protein